MCDLSYECVNYEPEKPVGHLNKIRPILEPSYQNLHSFFERHCVMCNQGFSTEEEAKEHAQLHGDINAKCPMCPKTFSNLNAILSHLRSSKH